MAATEAEMQTARCSEELPETEAQAEVRATRDGSPAEPMHATVDVLCEIRSRRTEAVPTAAEVASLASACTSSDNSQALLNLSLALCRDDGIALAVAIAACDAGAPFLLVRGLQDAAEAASQPPDAPPPSYESQLATTALWWALASLTAADRELNVRRIEDAGAAALAAKQMPRLLASFPHAVPFAATVICACLRALPAHPQCFRLVKDGGLKAVSSALYADTPSSQADHTTDPNTWRRGCLTALAAASRKLRWVKDFANVFVGCGCTDAVFAELRAAQREQAGGASSSQDGPAAQSPEAAARRAQAALKTEKACLDVLSALSGDAESLSLDYVRAVKVMTPPAKSGGEGAAESAERLAAAESLAAPAEGAEAGAAEAGHGRSGSGAGGSSGEDGEPSRGDAGAAEEPGRPPQEGGSATSAAASGHEGGQASERSTGDDPQAAAETRSGGESSERGERGGGESSPPGEQQDSAPQEPPGPAAHSEGAPQPDPGPQAHPDAQAQTEPQPEPQPGAAAATTESAPAADAGAAAPPQPTEPPQPPQPPRAAASLKELRLAAAASAFAKRAVEAGCIELLVSSLRRHGAREGDGLSRQVAKQSLLCLNHLLLFAAGAAAAVDASARFVAAGGVEATVAALRAHGDADLTVAHRALSAVLAPVDLRRFAALRGQPECPAGVGAPCRGGPCEFPITPHAEARVARAAAARAVACGAFAAATRAVRAAIGDGAPEAFQGSPPAVVAGAATCLLSLLAATHDAARLREVAPGCWRVFPSAVPPAAAAAAAAAEAAAAAGNPSAPPPMPVLTTRIFRLACSEAEIMSILAFHLVLMDSPARRLFSVAGGWHGVRSAQRVLTFLALGRATHWPQVRVSRRGTTMQFLVSAGSPPLQPGFHTPQAACAQCGFAPPPGAQHLRGCGACLRGPLRPRYCGDLCQELAWVQGHSRVCQGIRRGRLHGAAPGGGQVAGGAAAAASASAAAAAAAPGAGPGGAVGQGQANPGEDDEDGPADEDEEDLELMLGAAAEEQHQPQQEEQPQQAATMLGQGHAADEVAAALEAMNAID